MNTARPATGSDRAVVRGDRVSEAGASERLARPCVVKIGGRALEGARQAELARDIATLGGRAVLVHGGGATVSAWCARLGIEPRFHDGLRVTDTATLEVAAAVLGGLINKQWVALLQAHGLMALGLCALDAGLASVRPHRDVARLGEVGEVAGVDPALLLALLERGVTPVLASIGACDGRLLNVNADDLAAAVAGALAAPALVLLSDTPGLKLGGRVVDTLDAPGLAAAIEHPDVQGGMKPKLLAARHALAAGAGRVLIAAWNGEGTVAALLAGRGPGTAIAGTTGFAAPRAEPLAARRGRA